MAPVLLLSTLITLGGIVASAISGYAAESQSDVSRHILISLATVVIGLFAQSMTMFFFIGTGKELKNKVKGAPDERDILARSRQFKASVFPAAMWAMTALMVTFIIGGGVHTGKVPVWVHSLLSLISFLLFARAYWLELRAMDENAHLMEKWFREEQP